MNELAPLFWLGLFVGVVLVVGFLVGILVARRIDRFVAPPEEPGDGDDGAPSPSD